MFEQFAKEPINEIVDVLATTATPGYRVILTTDNCIYEYDSNGLPTIKDSNIGVGATVIGVGPLGDDLSWNAYYNGATFEKKTTPYFPAGNTFNITHCIIWADRLVIARWNGSNKSDIICILPNGNTYRNDIGITEITCMTVDSRNNLWIGHGSGVTRVQYDDTFGAYETFNVAGGYLVDNNITGMIACSEKVWLVTAYTTHFSIVLFDGNSFIDMTAQFETDIGIDADAMTAVVLYKVTQDSDTMYLTMTDATLTGNLIYYDTAVSLFKVKTLPSAFSGKYMTDFVKIGDYVYSILATTTTYGDAGVPYIWKYSDVSEIYTDTTAPKKVTANTQYVLFYEGTKIYRTSIIANDLTDETAWQNEIKALATVSYSGIQEISCNDTTYLVICYKSSVADYNDIIVNTFGLKWFTM